MSTVNFVRLHDVEPMIRAQWAAKQPFSLVRIGDGELSVLKYPHDVDEARIQHVFRRAMFDRPYSDAEILSVRAGMVQAVRSADVVGMHDSYESNDLCLVYEETVRDAGLAGMTACQQAVHIYLQSTGALDRLLKTAQRVTLITGRAVLEQVQEAYPHLTVDEHLIPVERQYELESEKGRQDQHYPDTYERIKDELVPDGPNHLYLVGAGLLGKEYCSIIKARGGFALDIGSIFDYWANVPTREGKRAIEDGKAALAGESRWPAIFLGAAPDPTGIAMTPHRGMLRPLEIIPRPRAEAPANVVVRNSAEK
jgi:hypothetical protein